MIKIDYEGAWKDLKDKIGDAIMEGGMTGSPIKFTMKMLEQKHTQNYIDIRKRTDKEIADYCLKKHAEVYLENIHLKKKLKEYQEKPIFDVYIEGILENEKYDGKKIIIQDMVNSKELAYYDTAFREGKTIKYKGKEMRIIQLAISYP